MQLVGTGKKNMEIRPVKETNTIHTTDLTTHQNISDIPEMALHSSGDSGHSWLLTLDTTLHVVAPLF